jgi:pimeloyl-ACP methyl ester carboxylesterase
MEPRCALAIDNQRTDLVVNANIAFHDVIYRAAGSATLWRLARELSDFVRRFSSGAFSSPERSSAVLGEHEAILDALERHDQDAAAAASSKHLRTTSAYLASSCTCVKQSTPAPTGAPPRPPPVPDPHPVPDPPTAPGSGPIVDPPTTAGLRPVVDPPTTPTVRLAHEVTGTGPPLLLIAGTGFPGATWRHDDLLRPLGERFTVITFDHRGTGDTPGTPGDYSTRLFAADALALLRELDLGPAHLVGHSMGGRVAQWMVLDGRDLVDSVVFAATGPGQFRHDQVVTRGIPVKTCLWMAEHGYEGYLRRHIPATFFTPEFAAAEPERVQWLVDAFWAHRPPLEDYLKHVISRQTHQSAHLLARMDVPSLVPAGGRRWIRRGTDVLLCGMGTGDRDGEHPRQPRRPALLRLGPGDARHQLPGRLPEGLRRRSGGVDRTRRRGRVR